MKRTVEGGGFGIDHQKLSFGHCILRCLVDLQRRFQIGRWSHKFGV